MLTVGADEILDFIPSDEFLKKLKRRTFREWLSSSEIYLRGKPYSTDKHEYLDQIIDDMHPHQTFSKAAQVGISTTILLRAIYVAEHLGKKAIYYFQDDGAVSDFSNDRCMPMLQDSPYLSSRIGDIDNVGLKHIGIGSIFFRGLHTKGKVKSLDGDFCILDELDEAKPENVKFAIDRLMHSDLQWVNSLSQPSLPGYGIDKEFQQTDQHYWHLVCPKCGHRNCLELRFPDNFLSITGRKRKLHPDGATHYIGCMKCGADLNPAKGEWIAKYPSKAKRGYHLSQLYSQIPPATHPNFASKVMDEWENSQKSEIALKRFTISVIGFPYGGGNARVTEELLDFCEGDYEFSFAESGAFMGVDQGDILSIVIGILSGHRLLTCWIEETESWDKLDQFMVRYGIRHCVIDALPNKHSAKTFAARHHGRVTIQYFAGKTLKIGQEFLEGRTSIQTVSVDRTEALDKTIDYMEQGLIGTPSKARSKGKQLTALEDFRRHCKQLISREEQMPGGGVKRVYLRGDIENHLGMALNSCRIAAFEIGTHPGPMVMPIFHKMGSA